MEVLSAEESLSLGDSYLVDEEFESSLDAYAAALSLVGQGEEKTNSTTTKGLCFRAHSHRAAAMLALHRYNEAVEDCEKALDDYVTEGGLRPGEAEKCYKRLGDALFATENFQKANQAYIKASELASLNGRPTHAYETLVTKSCVQSTATTSKKASPKSDDTSPAISNRTTTTSSPIPPLTSPPKASIANSRTNAKPKMPKYQYYQSDKFVTVSILEPNVQSDDLNVAFSRKRLKVTLRKQGVDFTVLYGPLYDEIDVEKSKTNIKEEKVLIKLRKTSTMEWQELLRKKGIGDDDNDDDADDNDGKLDKDMTKAPTDTSTESKKKSEKVRPYASHRDWDAIEKGLADEEKKDKPEGDAAMNALFQQLYQNADEDTRRAMIKSYQTSGGTVLSTNWDEVKNKDYEKERVAPKGIEWKTWEGKKLPMEDDDK